MGLTASCFGLGATLSNYIGQNVVQNFGHVASLSGSLVLSVIPIFIFGMFMPETIADRGSQIQHHHHHHHHHANKDEKEKEDGDNYVVMV